MVVSTEAKVQGWDGGGTDGRMFGGRGKEEERELSALEEARGLEGGQEAGRQRGRVGGREICLKNYRDQRGDARQLRNDEQVVGRPSEKEKMKSNQMEVCEGMRMDWIELVGAKVISL